MKKMMVMKMMMVMMIMITSGKSQICRHFGNNNNNFHIFGSQSLALYYNFQNKMPRMKCRSTGTCNRWRTSFFQNYSLLLIQRQDWLLDQESKPLHFSLTRAIQLVNGIQRQLVQAPSGLFPVSLINSLSEIYTMTAGKWYIFLPLSITSRHLIKKSLAVSEI